MNSFPELVDEKGVENLLNELEYCINRMLI
jgi:hypothetical protein